MSIIVLHNGKHVTVASDQRVFDSTEVGSLLSVCEQARLLASLHEGESVRISDAEQAGYRDGYRLGEAQGRAEVQQQLTQSWLTASEALVQERAHVRAQATELALAIVRRIADELDSEAVLAALARRASQQLLPDQDAVIRVHPSQVDGVRQRLAGIDLAPVGQIIGDDTLETQDCVLQTAEGTLAADLDTHLETLEVHLRE